MCISVEEVNDDGIKFLYKGKQHNVLFFYCCYTFASRDVTYNESISNKYSVKNVTT